MLAPRKRLWSTPLSALDVITQQWIPRLVDGDKIVDLGCGDGRILLEWAKRITQEYRNDSSIHKDTHNISLLGLDIDPDRIATCKQALESARRDEAIDSFLSIEFVCANALETTHWMKDGPPTIVFLYLIPRGLQLITPILRQIRQHIPRNNDDGDDDTHNPPSPEDPHVTEESAVQIPVPVSIPQAPSRVSSSSTTKLRVISYMAKLPGEPVKDRALLTVEHQPGAQWPLYYYELD